MIRKSAQKDDLCYQRICYIRIIIIILLNGFHNNWTSIHTWVYDELNMQKYHAIIFLELCHEVINIKDKKETEHFNFTVM